jgi:hypothetical protein
MDKRGDDDLQPVFGLYCITVPHNLGILDGQQLYTFSNCYTMLVLSFGKVHQDTGDLLR